jgi:hypothetical protein
LHVLVGKTGSSELAQVVSLGHVASSGISSSRRQDKKSVLVDAHNSALPKEGIGELYVDFANFDGVREMATR